MVTGLLPANLIVGPKFKQDTMQDAGVKLADGVKEDTTDWSRIWKQPTSKGMSTRSSRGPENIVVAADPEVTFWLILEEHNNLFSWLFFITPPSSKKTEYAVYVNLIASFSGFTFYVQTKGTFYIFGLSYGQSYKDFTNVNYDFIVMQ